VVQFGGAALEVVLSGVEGLCAVFDALELLVEPLLAVGETGFAALWSPRSSRTSSLTARISSSTSRRPWAACSAS